VHLEQRKAAATKFRAGGSRSSFPDEGTKGYDCCVRRKGRGHAVDPIGQHDTTMPAAPVVDPGGVSTRRSVFAVGAVVAGRYRVVRPIAAGGMGEVYAVDDRELHEVVALKTIRSDVAGDPAALARFRREIQLARKITHANVCRIFEFGFHSPGDGETVPFLTMELLSGETLTAYLRREGRLAPEAALPIAEQIADGLEAAHRAGIIHRDFKSGNVMLVPDRGQFRAVVTDFGLAKALVGDEGGALTGPRPLGTPAYMAPEQVTGDPVDERTDIYALGVVLFEMVTGRLPFSADAPLALAVKRVTEAAPSPAALVPALDSRWRTTIERCLAREPAARYASADEVVCALHAEERQTIVARPVRRETSTPDNPRRRRPVNVLLALGALSAIGAVLVVAYVLSPPQQDIRPDDERAIDVVPRREPSLPATPGDTDRVRTVRPPPGGGPLERGVEHLRRWEGVAARAALEDAVASSPRDARARLQLCRALLTTRNMTRAAIEAEHGLALDDVPPATRRLLQACRFRAISDFNGAAALYRRALAETQDSELAFDLADSEIAAHDVAGFESTVASLRAVQRPLQDDPRLDVLEGDARQARGDFDGAPALRACCQASQRAGAGGRTGDRARTRSGRPASYGRAEVRCRTRGRRARDTCERR